jgi:NADH:ubiquinone oxidoreductase subunit 3 (subunit A)
VEFQLLVPPIALLLNLALVALLALLGRVLAGPGSPSAEKTSTYSSGEAAPTSMAAPGYKPFFVTALFFAILHLGVLMLGSSSLSPIAGIYLAGLLLTLLALILG